jgi:hypothetical protein
MFGVACGVVVPFGDLCLGLPNTGEVCLLNNLHATGACACLFSIPSFVRRLRTICMSLSRVPRQSLTMLMLDPTLCRTQLHG